MKFKEKYFYKIKKSITYSNTFTSLAMSNLFKFKNLSIELYSLDQQFKQTLLFQSSTK